MAQAAVTVDATEREVEKHAGTSVGLNVFGGNVAPRRLYEAAGYDTISVEMRKRLKHDSA